MSTIETTILPTQIPPGYTARPVTTDDAEAAAELSNAYNMALTGHPSIEAGEIRSDWGQSTMNLAANTLAFFAPAEAMAGMPASARNQVSRTTEGRNLVSGHKEALMVGLAEVWDSEPHVRHFVFAEVHPAHQGLGIGAALAEWAEARGRQLLPSAPDGARVILRQFKMNADEAAGRLLAAQGYQVVRHNLRMVIDFDGPPDEPVVPQGLIIRPMIRNREEHATIMAVREEFRDHWGNVETPIEQDYEEWLHFMETSPTCDPSLFFVAVDGDQIAGTTFGQAAWVEDPEAGWIYALGVRRPWRRRGVALALLQTCFAEFYRRGKRRAKLGVDADSLTGATKLYEKAGMRVERVFNAYEKELRPGKDLSTQKAM